jgi:hypothetical protein
VYAVADGAPAGGKDPDESIYKSEIGECFNVLPKHIHILVGNIPDIDLPADFDCIEPADLIVSTDESVLFGVGYHS